MTVIGQTTCNIDRRANWEAAYSGYLMTVRFPFFAYLSAPTSSICMDKNSEAAKINVKVTSQSPQVTYVKSGDGLPWAKNRIVPCTVCIRVSES